MPSATMKNPRPVSIVAESSLCSRTIPTSVTSHASSVTPAASSLFSTCVEPAVITPLWAFESSPGRTLPRKPRESNAPSNDFELHRRVSRRGQGPALGDQAPRRERDRRRLAIGDDKPPSQPLGDGRGRPRAGEPVGDATVGVGHRAQHALDQPLGLLRRPAGALAVGVVERLDVGPPVLGHLAGGDGIPVDAAGAAIGLLLDAADQPHVRSPAARHAYRIGKERPVVGLAVPQDGVVLAPEPTTALAADRITPRDLV